MRKPEDMSREELEYEIHHLREIQGLKVQEVTPASYNFFTFFEEKLMRLLWQRKGGIITRGHIQDHCGDINHPVFDRTIDSHIKRIRRKLEKHGYPDEIQTSYGRGYFIETDAMDPFLWVSQEYEKGNLK